MERIGRLQIIRHNTKLFSVRTKFQLPGFIQQKSNGCEAFGKLLLRNVLRFVGHHAARASGNLTHFLTRGFGEAFEVALAP